MFDLFPRTEIVLLRSLEDVRMADDEEMWHHFLDLYHVPMLRFVESCGGGSDSEDVVQMMLVKLSNILREGLYRRQPNTRFSSFLKTMLRNELRSYQRSIRQSRSLVVPPDELEQMPTTNDPGEILDAKWRADMRMSATSEVLERLVTNKRVRSIFQDLVLEGLSVDEVSRKYKVTKKYVGTIKCRVQRQILLVEEAALKKDLRGLPKDDGL